MPETSTDEQELAKALDSVASLGQAKPSMSANDVANSPHDKGMQPIVPAGSPVAPSPTAPPTDGTDSSVVANDTSTPDIPEHTTITMPSSQNDAVDEIAAENDENNSEAVTAPTPEAEEPVEKPADETPPVEMPKPNDAPEPPVGSGPLDSIKSEALNELRPLVGKLELPPEEKFDTLLLLLRSTDDTDLIAPAHEAAKSITDETKRAAALLEVIKEIDYLTKQKPAN